MSEHTLYNGGLSLLDDVDMEDLSDLAEALLPEAVPHESNNARDDTDAMDEVTQSLPAEGGAANAQNDVHSDTTDTNSMNATTSAEPETTPNQSDCAVSNDEAAAQRLEMLQSLFAGQDVELKHFASPPQCAQQPDLAEDILEAFLELDARQYNFSHVRLEIGTPFRKLVEMELNVRELNGETLVKATGRMCDQHPPIQLPILVDYINVCLKQINSAELNRNLNMEDLGAIASIFRRQHEDDDYEDEWDKPRYGGGEWVGVEEPLFRGIRW